MPEAFRLLRRFVMTAIAATAAAGAPAHADDYGNPSGKPYYALADLRLAGADGEPAWLDGGFGKARFGGAGGGDFRVRPSAIEGDLVWLPQLGWSLEGTLAVTAQRGQEHAVDLSEAYVTYRHGPIGALRLSARLGLFWPPISLEHSGPAWSVTETITPSAINSWVGEELKVAAAEANASLPLGGGRIAVTAALFGLNDTSGTLLAFRGWALHDEKATAFGHQPLPPLDAFMQYAQAPRTRPVIELDHRVGFYARVAWSSPALKVQAFYYDNRGDPEVVNADLQWGWRTRFANLGATLRLDPRTSLTSQAMQGTTRMGYPMNGRIWVDTRFRSAFLLGTRTLGEHGAISGRIEAFDTDGRGSVLAGGASEDGWAATLAGRRAFGEHVSVLGELLHIESDRGERVRAGVAPRQDQTVVQLSARLSL